MTIIFFLPPFGIHIFNPSYSPIAVALYDYDTEDRLGEDGNLSFYEGEIIEVSL